jgi:hypothetical protein
MVYFRDKFRRALLRVTFGADSVRCAPAGRVIPKVDELPQIAGRTGIGHRFPGAILHSLKLKRPCIEVFAAIKCNCAATIHYKRTLMPALQTEDNQAVFGAAVYFSMDYGGYLKGVAGVIAECYPATDVKRRLCRAVPIE